jgi:hypothetical protein
MGDGNLDDLGHLIAVVLPDKGFKRLIKAGSCFDEEPDFRFLMDRAFPGINACDGRKLDTGCKLFLN